MRVHHRGRKKLVGLLNKQKKIVVLILYEAHTERANFSYDET